MPSYTKTVWEDYPSQDTLINATRLNNIEDGIEALYENQTVVNDSYNASTDETYSCNYVNNLEPVVLFESSAGSNSNITLSDSVANYSYIEIFFRNNDDYYSFNKFENINSKSFCLISTAIDVSTATLRIKTSNYSANNTNINFISAADWNLKVNSGTVSDNVSNNIIYITKIIGYK